MPEQAPPPPQEWERLRAGVQELKLSVYKVVGPHEVVGVPTGELVTLSDQHAALLIEAGHIEPVPDVVAVVAEEPTPVPSDVDPAEAHETDAESDAEPETESGPSTPEPIDTKGV